MCGFCLLTGFWLIQNGKRKDPGGRTTEINFRNMMKIKWRTYTIYISGITKHSATNTFLSALEVISIVNYFIAKNMNLLWPTFNEFEMFKLIWFGLEEIKRLIHIRKWSHNVWHEYIMHYNILWLFYMGKSQRNSLSKSIIFLS